MTNLRELGVEGGNLPTKKSKIVVASNFLVGGIVGKFERKYNKAFSVTNPTEFREIFGEHVNPNFYGCDAVKGFFDNVVGAAATLYLSSHVGHTGSAIDAVVASALVPNTQPENVLTISAAYQLEPEYGISGLRTGYTITPADRFTTAANGTALATAFSCTLDSVVGIRVGDIVRFTLTAGGGGTAYHTITAVNQALRTITWTDSQLHATLALTDNDVVAVIGFRLRLWRKSLDGIVSEVDEDLGKVICTTETIVADYFVGTVFARSKWVKVVRNTTSTSTATTMMPAAVATPTYLTGGADGTAPTTAAHWANALSRFDNLPVRFIANPETTDDSIQNAGETYGKARATDQPIWIRNILSNQSKSQLKVIGQNIQRADDVIETVTANWLGVSDPFSTSALGVDREVPSVGHIIGMWIRSIAINGIHFIPALKSNPIFGANKVVGDTFLSNADRTELASCGINIIQDLPGYGIMLRNFFTPSTTLEFMFANAILMRNYFKVSGTDSLQDSENTPNSLNRIQSDKRAMLVFYYDHWERGSTGNVPPGETFGQFENDDGTATKPTDHFEVKADITNNPRAKIQLGERNIDSWFMAPTPAGSIKVRVGLILK
jgi:hypothetical protein